MSAVIDLSDRRFISRPWTAAIDPTVTDDRTKGVQVGDTWFNTASGNIFDAVAVTAGAAVWRHRPRSWASGAAVSGPADTLENTLATIAIPAGAMGPNGVLRLTTLWTVTNGADDKTLFGKFGGVGFFSRLVTNVLTVSNCTLIRNRNNAASQVSFFEGGGTSGGWGDNTNANKNGTVDTTTAQNITINCQKETGANTITLESYLVELTRPDIGP